MKISKSLIQVIALAVAVSTATVACTKEKTPDPESTEIPKYGCPACGMG